MKPLLRLSLGAAVITGLEMASFISPTLGHAQQPSRHPRSLGTASYNCLTAPDGSGRYCVTIQADPDYEIIKAISSQGGAPLKYDYSTYVQLTGTVGCTSGTGHFQQSCTPGGLRAGCYYETAKTYLTEYTPGAIQQVVAQTGATICF